MDGYGANNDRDVHYHGKTMGENMLEAEIREAVIQRWWFRLKVLTCIVALGALTKYLIGF
jgi:hypothetical protein